MSGVSTRDVFYADKYHPIQAGSIDGTDVAPHDNAVLRALICSEAGLYDPFGDPKATGDPYCMVFVGRLSRQTDDDTLRKAMSRYGSVMNMRLVRDIVTGASRGYAFVEYETDREMRRAYQDAHHSIIDGSEVIVDYYRQQLMTGWIPRRLGGGLGGRKESGQLRFGGRERPFRAPLQPIPYESLGSHHHLKGGICHVIRFHHHPGGRVAILKWKIHLLGEDPRTRPVIVPTGGKEVLLMMMKPLAGGKAATMHEKNHKAEGVQGHPLPGRTAATAVRGSPRDMMVMVSGDEAENQVKYLRRRRMVATKERELQLNLVAARVGTRITTGITGRIHTRAATLSTESAGAMVTGIIPREARAEITATSLQLP